MYHYVVILKMLYIFPFQKYIPLEKNHQENRKWERKREREKKKDRKKGIKKGAGEWEEGERK